MEWIGDARRRRAGGDERECDCRCPGYEDASSIISNMTDEVMDSLAYGM